MTRLRSARAAALRRLRGNTADDDRGFVLIYVLMVISIVTVLVGTVLVVSAASVVPSVQGAYNQAAEAAAQGGVQAFLGTLESDCTTSAQATVSACAGSLPTSGSATIYQNAGYQSTYNWSVAQTTDGHFRVTSVGAVSNGGVHAQRKLIADISGGTPSSPFDYSSATQYETQAPDVMALQYPTLRNITIDAATALYADKLTGSGAFTASWNGPSTTSTAGSVNSCNNIYFGATGREFNPVPNASPYVDWTETGAGRGQSVADPQPCQVSLGSSTKLIAPANSGSVGAYCTNDALLLSNSDPGSAGGPLLDAPVDTLYSGIADPGGVAGRNYRSFDLPGYNVAVGGSPAAASTYSPTTVNSCPGPITTSPTIPTGSCVYKGPTRVWLNGDTAVVTSPETTTAAVGSPSGCYPASVAGGIYAFTITSLAALTGFSGVFSVANSGTAPATLPATHTSTGWNAVTSTSAVTNTNSVFYKTIPASGPSSSLSYAASAADKPYTPAVGDNPSTKTDASWSPAWTGYTSGTTCDKTTSGTDLKLFNCSMGGGSYSATAYTTFKQTVQAALLANPQNYTTAAALQTYLNTLLAAGKSADANNATPTFFDSRSHRWSASVVTDATATGGCTPLVGATSAPSNSTISAPFSPDPLFTNSNGNTSTTTQTTTSCLTATVTLQVGTCSVALLGGLCLGTVGWGNGGVLLGGGATIPQFSMTETQQTTTTTTSSTAATSSFPAAGDVSLYGMGPTGSTSTTGPGDLYVEGTTSRSLSLVAANDVIVTGALTPANSSTTGIEVVGQDNVRVYHPVTCKAGVSLNASGVYCNDDLTGLYNTIPANGFRPYQQYTNLRSDLANISINAAIFALGDATSTVACPKWNGAGTCGGEFTVDNYNRGTSLSTLNLTGGLIQVHHGALGEEWEVLDTSGQTRPQTGYNLTLTYQNVKTLLGNANVLQNVTTSPAVWHIVSTSTGS